MPNTTIVGHEAETVALEFLQTAGLRLVERNFRCRMGEIDLIMRDGELLCFVEVRLRKSRRHASGADSVTRSKIRKLRMTAEYFLQTRGSGSETGYRFDVVSIDDSIDWISDAFTADDE